MTSTKQQILALAEQLIRTKGYHAFSYKDISTPLGIKNAAIHYHFPSKADLGAAVIEHNRTEFQKASQHWGALSPRQQVEHFIDIYTRSQNRGWVCVMGALGPAYPSLPPTMQDQLRLMGQELLDWAEAVLSKGKTTGTLDFEGTPQQQAHILVNALLSSLITSRVLQRDYTSSVAEGLLQQL